MTHFFNEFNPEVHNITFSEACVTWSYITWSSHMTMSDEPISHDHVTWQMSHSPISHDQVTWQVSHDTTPHDQVTKQMSHDQVTWWLKGKVAFLITNKIYFLSYNNKTIIKTSFLSWKKILWIPLQIFTYQLFRYCIASVLFQTCFQSTLK